MLNINDELDGNYMGGGYGWHPFIAGYFLTTGAMDAMKSYKLFQVYVNLVGMHVSAHAQTTSVAKIEIKNSRASISLNYIGDAGEKTTQEIVPIATGKELSLTLYVGSDNIICLPCEN